MASESVSTVVRASLTRMFLLVMCTVLLFAPGAFAESSDGIWLPVQEASINRTAAPRLIVPSNFRTFRLQRHLLDTLLAQVPMERDVTVQRSVHMLSLPLPDGSYGKFRIVESPIMEAELAAKFPQIRTWSGQGIDEPSATVRFDLTPSGFHAQILSWQGSVFIDPYQRDDTENYISYHKRDVMRAEPMICSVTGQEIPADLPNFQKRGMTPKVSSGTRFRTYRLAVAATGEYTAFHGGTVPLGLAAIVTTVNRVNAIYERDLATRMLLVANNNVLIYTNAGTDPYTNNDGFAMLAENQSNVTTQIGAANYDVGHVVSTGGGGVAGLGVVCSNTQKARGVTGSPAPVGDPFDVDYVAHEIGHQFGGNHTFNSTSGSCGDGNRNASTAYEVGSGITIQAYAGICSPSNVQNNSSDYFHRASLNEMLAFIGSTACPVDTASGNTPPTVSTDPAFTIPARTPFELTATGSDGNGDALTYIWEQFNLGVEANAPITDNGSSPIFRNFSPTTSPSRVFPRLPDLLAGVTPAYEILPTTSRTLNFRVTARDNRANAGGTNEASTALTVIGSAGPFVVTAPNTAVTWLDASNQNITWNVANTAVAPISTANVRVRLSTDGGNTWPITLAESVLNNGSASVFVPASVPATTQARIRVEAVGNVYFDVSNVNFTISDNPNPTNEPNLSITATQVIKGNNLIEPNECNQLNITLSNTGPVAATGVSATLSTSNPNVTLTQATASFANIAAGGSQISSTPFQLSTTGALVCLSNIDLTLTVSYGGGGSPFVGNFSLPVGEPPVLGNYAFTSSTGSIPVGGTFVTGSAVDDAVVDLTVPSNFNFNVYGTAVAGGSVVRVGTNGNLQIVSSGGSAEHNNGALPSAGTGNNLGIFPAALPVLMPYWDDLAPDAVAGGGIFQHIIGSAPNRTWIIEWRAERFNAPGTAISSNFAIEFTEGSSTFSYLYGTVDNGGATATIGVQAATSGSAFTQHSLNSSAVVAGQRLSATRSSSGGGCTPGSGPCAPAGVTITQTSGNTAVVEGATTDSYSLALTSQPSADVVISITADTQITRSPATLTFTTLNWATPQNVTVSAVDDRTVEGAHTSSLTHSAAGGGYDAVSIGAVSVAVTDNDSATYQFTAASSSVSEATANATISVSTTFNANGTGSIALAAPITVPFTVNAGSTASGSGVDYSLASSSVSVPVSGATQNISVAIVNDSSVEPTETLILDLGAETGGSAGQQAVVTAGAPAAHTLSIVDNDTAGVTITQSNGNTAVVEGATTDSYSLALTSQPSADVVISITADTQITRSPATLTFTTLNWATPQNVTVSAVDDRTVEGAHTGSLAHSAAGGGYDAVSIGAVSVAVTDNDSATYQFTAASSNVSEATANATISVSTTFNASGTGSIALAAPITVPFTINAGSTASGSGVDYSLASSSVSVPVSGTTQNISVAIVNDSLVEPTETLILDLGAETGGNASQQAVVTAGSPAAHTLSIVDNDTAGVIGADVVQAEGNSANNMPFTFTLNTAVAGGFNLNYQTRNDTALAGSDYVAATGSVSFTGTAAESRTINIGILGDVVPEANERFFLDLSTNNPAVQVTPVTLSGEIVNDDLIADLQLSLQRLPGAIFAGGPISYQLQVQNLSSVVAVPGAALSFNASAQHVNISWTCTAASGSSCPASGSGAPAHNVSLGTSAGVTYTINASVAAGTGGAETLTSNGTISANAPYSDPVAGNNAATVQTTLTTDGVFANGFEGP